MSTTYSAIVSREDKWWIVHVPEIENAVTQVRRLADVESVTRSLIALMLEVPEDSFDLRVTLSKLGSLDVQKRVETLRAHRRALAEMQAAVQRESTELARELSHHGLPVRDIGAALDVSYQRAQQLVDA